MKRETQGKMKRPPEILPTATTAFILEAGCDEAGRGCLAGPAVILPDGYTNPLLNDSKKLTEHQREQLRPIIERDALAWGVGWATNEEIDDINILNASILAMHRALDSLGVQPGQIAVDGNRFKPYRDIPHVTIVKGDGKYANIAAASILAKTHRDEWMRRAAIQHPGYRWEVNKGYPTADHRAAIAEIGTTPLHRLTFRLS